MKKTSLFELAGWSLFTVGSGIFLYDGIIHANLPLSLASGAFLLGCVCFLLDGKIGK